MRGAVSLHRGPGGHRKAMVWGLVGWSVTGKQACMDGQVLEKSKGQVATVVGCRNQTPPVALPRDTLQIRVT